MTDPQTAAPQTVAVPLKQQQAYDAIIRGLRSAAAHTLIAALLAAFGGYSWAQFLPPPWNFIIPTMVGGSTVMALAKFLRDKFGFDWLPV